MTYYVTYRVDGRYTMCVEADSIESAKKEAELDFMDAELGDTPEVVEAYPVIVEDENDIVWEA